MLCFYAFASVKQLLLFCCASGIDAAGALGSTTSSGFKIILINFVVATITYKTIVYSRFALPLSHSHLLAHSLSFQTAR